MEKPIDHPPVAKPRIGVLLVNLGTPDAATPGAVKRYLREFLSDRRVVELPPILWQPLLRGIVLNIRSGKSAHAYSQIWTDDGSPLDSITRGQVRGLANSFGPGVTVDYAMRYGKPSIPEKLHALKAMGCDRILIAPLYPQYSGATTATVNDKAFETLARMRWQPAIRTLPPYHDDPVYISALKDSIEASIAGLDFQPEMLIASFHSMPEATLSKGDPYHCQCQKTARLLSDALGRDLIVSFQSKLGRAKWLGPPTEATLSQLAADGVRSIAVVTPGFSVDNLETLEEIAIRGRDTFFEGGGKQFASLPCLNDTDSGIEMLRILLARELEGWAASL